jgi:hypothetical protein
MVIQNTTTDSQSRLAGPDPTGDQILHDVLDALTQNCDVEQYLQARQSGATHAEVLEARTWYEGSQYDPLLLANRAMRAGATFNEVKQVGTMDQRAYGHASGFRAYLYAEYRRKGISHAEFMFYDNFANGAGDLEKILEAVDSSGLGYARSAAYFNAGGHDLQWYVKAIAAGATDLDVLDVLVRTGRIHKYASALNAGVTHAEFVEVLGFPDTKLSPLTSPGKP